MAGGTDLYMNFLNVDVTTDAADASALESSEINTGLSIRGGLAMLVHKIEIFFPDELVNGVYLECALSTRKGLTTMPGLNDGGCIAKARRTPILAGAAYGVLVEYPQTLDFLPPVPLAAPKISLYAAAEADDASYRSKKIEVRIGFTTQPMESKMYLEIAETWGYDL